MKVMRQGKKALVASGAHLYIRVERARRGGGGRKGGVGGLLVSATTLLLLGSAVAVLVRWICIPCQG